MLNTGNLEICCTLLSTSNSKGYAVSHRPCWAARHITHQEGEGKAVGHVTRRRKSGQGQEGDESELKKRRGRAVYWFNAAPAWEGPLWSCMLQELGPLLYHHIGTKKKEKEFMVKPGRGRPLQPVWPVLYRLHSLFGLHCIGYTGVAGSSSNEKTGPLLHTLGLCG